MSISIFPALWRTSKLDQLLESSSELTMEMLEQDDIVEEARFLNERLVRLLATPKAITLLLTHALEGPLPPSPNPNGANPSAPSGPPGRLPAVCTELLNLGLSQVLQILFSHPELLIQYFHFLNKPAPLPAVNALHFCKLGVMLLDRAKLELYNFMRDKAWITQRLVEHLSTQTIADFVLSMVRLDQTSPTGFSQMLLEHGLITGLLKHLNNEDTYQIACQCLMDIVHVSTAPSALVAAIDTEATVEKLLEHAVEGRSAGSNMHPQGVDVVSALLGWYKYNVHALLPTHSPSTPAPASPSPPSTPVSSDAPTSPASQAEPSPVTSPAPSSPKSDEVKPEASGQTPPAAAAAAAATTLSTATIFEDRPVVRVVLSHLPRLTQVLRSALPETEGGQKGPFGFLRLKVLQLIVALVALGVNARSIYAALVQQGVIPLCVQLMFAFEYNNFVHHHVEDAVRFVLESDSAELRAQLLEAPCALPERIAALLSVDPPVQTGVRGHLTRIANTIALGPHQQRLLETCEPWARFCRERLETLNRIEGTQLGSFALLDLYPELARFVELQLAQRTESSQFSDEDEDSEEEGTPGGIINILENEEGELPPTPKEPVWL